MEGITGGIYRNVAFINYNNAQHELVKLSVCVWWWAPMDLHKLFETALWEPQI